MTFAHPGPASVTPTSVRAFKSLRSPDDLTHMPPLRQLWQAWDRNPASGSGRRFIYWFFGLYGATGLIVMLVIGQWVAAAFMAFFLAVALESGARTPGTCAERVVSRLRRGGDA